MASHHADGRGDHLGDLLGAHARGEDTSEQFETFMAEHGEYFPDGPENVEQPLDSLARRAAAAQRVRNSLTPDQRAKLAERASKHGKTLDDAKLLQRFERVILAPTRRRDAR